MVESKYFYGITQNPDTKEYILVFHNNYFENHCKECIKNYTNAYVKWCKPCQINYLKKNFTNWTSENEKIDDFIQEKQLNVVLFEWVPYNQFDNIKKMNKDDLATAMWKDDPLYYNKKWVRKSDENVALKYISQNDIDELLNKV